MKLTGSKRYRRMVINFFVGTTGFRCYQRANAAECNTMKDGLGGMLTVSRHQEAESLVQNIENVRKYRNI